MPDRLYHLLGGAVAIVAALILLRSLFWDRSRGHRRCPRCWYVMDGVPGLTCPECGRTARSERSTHRTRRHRRLAALGALLAIGGWLIAESPGIRRRGWIAMTPTTALIWWNLHHPPPTPVYGARFVLSSADTELVDRMNRGGLADWQWRWFFERLPLIRAHGRWDTQTPLPIEINPPIWVPIDRVRVVPKLRNANDMLCVRPDAQDAGLLAPDQREAVFEVSVKIGPITKGKWRWTGDLHVPAIATASTDDAFPPALSHDLDCAVGRAMWLRARDTSRKSGTPPDVTIVIGIDRSVDDRLRDLAFGFVVDVMRDGNVLHSLSLPATSVRLTPTPTVYTGFNWIEQRKIPDAAELARWSLRIRGDRTNAIPDWTHGRYWAGELFCPLAPYFSADR